MQNPPSIPTTGATPTLGRARVVPVVDGPDEWSDEDAAAWRSSDAGRAYESAVDRYLFGDGDVVRWRRATLRATRALTRVRPSQRASRAARRAARKSSASSGDSSDGEPPGRLAADLIEFGPVTARRHANLILAIAACDDEDAFDALLDDIGDDDCPSVELLELDLPDAEFVGTVFP